MTPRLARPTDASSLAALSMEVWLNTYIRRGINAFFADFALETFTTAKMLALLEDSAEHVVVSDNAEGIDGFLRLTHGRAAPVAGCSDLEITTLYVQGRHQGHGIGARLLDHGCNHCRSVGAYRPWLAVNTENDAAIAFYTARGFAIVGETRFTIDDRSYPNHIMAIDIAP